MTVFEFDWPVRVYIEDTDAGGIVYYVNYLKYMERARTEYLRAIGFAKAAMFDNLSMFVVRAVNTHYHRPARLDDELRVCTQIVELKSASLRMKQDVYRRDELLVDAVVELACVNISTMKPIRIPAAVKAAMQHCI